MGRSPNGHDTTGATTSCALNDGGFGQVLALGGRVHRLDPVDRRPDAHGCGHEVSPQGLAHDAGVGPCDVPDLRSHVFRSFSPTEKGHRSQRLARGVKAFGTHSPFGADQFRIGMAGGSSRCHLALTPLPFS